MNPSLSPPVPFGELRPGLQTGTWTVPVRDKTARRLAEGAGATFVRGDPVSPALAANLAIGISFRILPRNVLHTHQRIAIVGTVRVGDELHVNARVGHVGRRREKAFVSVEWDIRVGGPQAERVWSGTSEFFVPGMEAAGLETVDSVPPPQEELAGYPESAADTWAPSLESLVAFSGPGNFHSDPEMAQSYGYPRPVAQGMHLAARAMSTWPRVAETGRLLQMWFTGITLQDDVVRFSLRDASDGVLRVVAGGTDGRNRMILVSGP